MSSAHQLEVKEEINPWEHTPTLEQFVWRFLRVPFMEFVPRSVGVRHGALSGKCRLLAFGVSAMGEPPMLSSIFLVNGWFLLRTSTFLQPKHVLQSYWLYITISQVNFTSFSPILLVKKRNSESYMPRASDTTARKTRIVASNRHDDDWSSEDYIKTQGPVLVP